MENEDLKLEDLRIIFRTNCWKCRGSGFIEVQNRKFRAPCDLCQGTGQAPDGSTPPQQGFFFV